MDEDLTVTLKLRDGMEVEVNEEIASQSNFIKMTIQDSPEEIIPLKNVDSKAWATIYEFLEYHHTNSLKEIP